MSSKTMSNAQQPAKETQQRRIRKNFGRIRETVPIPNLIEVQKSSYEEFLCPKRDLKPGDAKPIFNLEEAFRAFFPVRDYSEQSQIDFVSYELEKPKYDMEECRQRGLTFAAPLKVKLRLAIWDIDEETGARSIRDIKEQEVYMGDMPLMTPGGTFIVNGTERITVSQMQRSPGVFFDHDRGKNQPGKLLFSGRVIPYHGSWLDMEFDTKDILFVRIDRKRKLPATTLLMALESVATKEKRLACEAEGNKIASGDSHGMTKSNILRLYYPGIAMKWGKSGWCIVFDPEKYQQVVILSHDLIDAETGKVFMMAGERLTLRKAKKIHEEGLKNILISAESLSEYYLLEDVIDEETGEVYAEAGESLDAPWREKFEVPGAADLEIIDQCGGKYGIYLRNTLAIDKNNTREDALMDIYKVMRPGELPTWESADLLFRTLFFERDRYDLSAVGRVKLNARLGFKDIGDEVRVLHNDDITGMVRVLLELRDGRGDIDDIDHLGNRRVRSVGELLENQFRIGLSRMERAIRERMSSIDIDTAMPQDLINAKPLAMAVREFFIGSQLSQFMDQTNPLSEITHKRRLSALGPGGLTRERAGFEVRDVHPTHYGRICPIETPEGPNIGLINSLATHARVNRYGFIETPYRRVEAGKVTEEVIYMSAIEDNLYTIAQSNAVLDADNRFTTETISCRRAGDSLLEKSENIDFMDVSPKQIVSVAASLIPFLENDDANRALMGSNMQRQAVPLLRAEAPIVGTGMEDRVARDSGVILIARRKGIVDQVDATRVVVRVTEEIDSHDSAIDIYDLMKFQRSNQSTCINQRPLVKVGDKVKRGDILADGPSTDQGELALGRNVLVAFLPWNGYNFEDSILLSERIVSDDVFTSIHIEEYEVMARDTKLGQEEITRDIPNVGEEALRNLDESGVVYIGSEVKSSDILVGKVTPKGESPITPEEKLLRAIFGEKASDVRDSSLRISAGGAGTVVEVRVFSRRGIEKDERSLSIEQAEIERLAKDHNDEKSILERSFAGRMKARLLKQKIASGPKDVKAGSEVTAEMLESLTLGQMRQIIVEDSALNDALENIRKQFDGAVNNLQERFEDKVDKLQRGADLLPGVMKMVKIFVAVKRKIQPGDKMAGRHGNKGVISRIVPIEDMPWLEDGTPVDIVLNPLGVPSRMNVGQVLETHLGWAGARLGQRIDEKLKAIRAGREDASVIRDQLKAIYCGDVEHIDIDALDDASLFDFAKTLRKGVPMATPVFDGAREEDINKMLGLAGLESSGQMKLIDGRTGDIFDREVTVGYIYMLKLHHLVDDKIHARSIGPYSLVTQQPLGGKAQFGGQRFGEMEVWALEAYGTAYTLQEMLTIKSDDISGRTKVYEAIIRGDENFETGIPESFNVLVKELRSLCLNVELSTQQSDYK